MASPTVRIYKEFTFEAAHFLPSAPSGHANSRLHGHSFHVRAVLEGVPNADDGLVMHFEQVEAVLAETKDKLDHRLLNEVEGLQHPTIERIGLWIWAALAPRLPGLREVHVARPSCGEGCIITGESHAAPRA